MKSKLSYQFSYRRRLPHIQPEGATFFVTSRLAASLPVEVIERLRREKERLDRELKQIVDRKEREEKTHFQSQYLFGKWDDALGSSNTGVHYLSDPRIADLVSEALHYRDGKVYDLIVFCIMPNHVHIVFTPLKESQDKYCSLSKIMHSLKRHTAREANLILGCEGAFWQHESYDHIIRDEAELERIIKYVLYNPVKARLVKEQNDWKWAYCKHAM
ncbi:MAG: transposase [Anaerolineales bacterium]|nr:transposase [Anaerolineales bacterium]